MRVTIVLVAPARAENIGAAARAMKTMGFTDLRIVDSQAHLEPATRWVAHGSGDIIDNIEVFSHPCRRAPRCGFYRRDDSPQPGKISLLRFAR